VYFVLFFFFQAEDGIRDGHVTGVQTCALPIFLQRVAAQPEAERLERDHLVGRDVPEIDGGAEPLDEPRLRGLRRRLEEDVLDPRSEERRVGKECSARGARERVKEEQRRVV